MAFLIRRLPEKWFKEEKGILKTTKFELKLYNFLHVSKWKEHVPELGSFTGFHKNKVTNPFDEEKTRALLTTLIRLSDRKNQPENRITHLPELPLSILEMAFSYAALYSRDELSVTDLIRAVEHTNLLKKDIRMHAQDYWQNNEFQLT